MENPLKKYIILYIEDDEEISLRVAKILKMFFADVKLAKNGSEALEIYNNATDNKIDLIITDVTMPLMNGYDFAIKLRKTNKDIPIIFTSAVLDSSILNESKELGISYYFNKPIDIQNLIIKCNEILVKNVN